MTAKLKNKRFCIGILILFNFLVNLPCFTYNYLQDPDEFCSIAFPVYLAGGDWSDIVANTGKWHGYGHVFIFAPFIKFCKTWTEMYNVCRIGSLIAWIGLSIEIFYIASKYFELENTYSLLVALVCTLGNLKPDYGIGLSTMTELPMGIIAISCMFFLVKIHTATTAKKRIYSVFLFFLLLYSLSIHSRAIVLILTVMMLIFLALILKRGMIVSPLFSMIGGGIGFLTYKLLDQYYVHSVLTTAGGMQGSIGNNISSIQSAGISKILAVFVSLENINKVFEIFFSLLSGFSILSFGLINLFVVIGVQYIIKYIRSRSKATDNMAMGIFIGLASYFLMNGLLAIQSYKTVLSGDYRWYIYLRYAMPFVIVIVFTGLTVILKKACEIKKALSIATIINICMIVYFIKVPLQELKDTGIMGNLSNIFRQYFYNGENAGIYFYKMIMVTLAIWFFVSYSILKNKQLIAWGSYVVISIAFAVSSFKWHYEKAQTVYAYTDASEEIIKLLGEESLPFDVKIYSSDKSESFHRYLRISCPWIEIYYANEENFESMDWLNSIVLSGKDNLDTITEGIYKIVLDDNEFLYVKDADIYNWISDELKNK